MKLRPSHPSVNCSDRWPRASGCPSIAGRGERTPPGHRRDAAQPGRAATGPVRRAAGRIRARRAVRRRRGGLRCAGGADRSGRGRTAAGRPGCGGAGASAPREVLGALAAAVYGHPSRTLRVIGVTGTSGKTTTTYLIGGGSAGRGPDRRPDRHRRDPHRRPRRAQLADHPGSPRSAGAAGGDGGARGGHRGDGGVQPCADAGPGRRDGLRGRWFHQPLAGPSRLPSDDGGLPGRQGPVVRTGFAPRTPPRGDLRRR